MPQRWTAEERQLLVNLRGQIPPTDWAIVASRLPSHSLRAIQSQLSRIKGRNRRRGGLVAEGPKQTANIPVTVEVQVPAGNDIERNTDGMSDGSDEHANLLSSFSRTANKSCKKEVPEPDNPTTSATPPPPPINPTAISAVATEALFASPSSPAAHSTPQQRSHHISSQDIPPISAPVHNPSSQTVDHDPPTARVIHPLHPSASPHRIITRLDTPTPRPSNDNTPLVNTETAIADSPSSPVSDVSRENAIDFEYKGLPLNVGSSSHSNDQVLRLAALEATVAEQTALLQFTTTKFAILATRLAFVEDTARKALRRLKKLKRELRKNRYPDSRG
ncbi:hypothetical protein BJY04DRAFT_218083 [Aspergillus karnatakaensis]|uniref:uncharacterized protein n=1 Tax=Aspergillus karnatakaensis TaxID=1810916 RepID=UPI003CCD973E